MYNCRKLKCLKKNCPQIRLHHLIKKISLKVDLLKIVLSQVSFPGRYLMESLLFHSSGKKVLFIKLCHLELRETLQGNSGKNEGTWIPDLICSALEGAIGKSFISKSNMLP